MTTVCKTNQCAGCMACIDICPKKCITVKDDLVAYNAIIDEEECIKCNICHKVCPNNNNIEGRYPISWYQGWAEDSIREKASSGGVATALINSFDGKICACSFEEGKFVFKFDEKKEAYVGSKYVKSNPLGIYGKIKKYLIQGEKVLFIGLPCQVAAVIKYTNNHENLYTVDLICHGSPSPKLLEMYLQERGKKLNKLSKLDFRKKSNFGLFLESKRIVPDKVQDMYTYAFLKGIDYTENCYSCKYARLERVSDISIGDSWGSELPIEEQKKGVSLILCQTEKGKKLLLQAKLILHHVDLNKAVDANGQLVHPSVKPEKREKFFNNINKGFHRSIFVCYPKFFLKQGVKRKILEIKSLFKRNYK